MVEYFVSYRNKWRAMSPVAKSSMALVFAKFFERGLSMISGPIFTRIMPTAEYGIISTFTSWQNVLYIIATLNMASGVFNNGMIDFKKDRESFTYSILCLANLCTFVCGGIYLLFYKWLNPLVDMPDSLMVVMFLYFIFIPAYNYWMGRQRFEYKYKAITAVILGSSLLSIVLSVICVLMAPDHSKAVTKVVTAESVSICIGIFFFITTTMRSRGKLKLAYWKYAFTFNMPLIPHYLSMYVLSSSDRIMISKLVNTSATAVYNVAYTVAGIMLIFWNAVDASYAPWIYQQMERKNYKSIQARGNQVLLFFAALTILCTLFAPEIIGILAPESYYSGIYVVPSVAAGVFFTACYSLYMRLELYLKKTKIVMIATCSVAVLNLVLNYIFIPQFGFVAAGYTTLVCYALLAFFHYCSIKLLGYGHVYNNKRILCLSCLVSLITVIVSGIYSYMIIRYILIAVLGVIMIIKRKEIVKMLRK
ncbi:lipopolysaccharide biosynthesis protein [Clostridium sp. Marseille-P2415]|uniref:lipopolysaccharide biosynthesis protein n=1 Tax=Clostridium sp. Marseille-P2415 TaxID=1805471 RepID=UPI00098845FD|nr:oligosaccharide flippase family protein [Clostridium sp. Marseille-P2415]